jgi:transcriptional regulator with XRE-family HTH domain
MSRKRRKAVKVTTIQSVRVDGQKLKRLRRDRFLSRAEVAERSGLHYDHLGRIERGYGGSVRIDNIRKIAEALGVDPRELVQPTELIEGEEN